MTIASETRRAGPYSGNGSTQVFNFSFKTYSSADIVVVTTTSGVDTVKTITTHYTVSLNADQNASPGGSITMLTAPASGTTVTIVSDRAALQSLNAQNAGAFLPTVLNDAMDNLAIGIGQLQDQQERSLRGALSDSAWDRLPPASERAGGLLGFDDSTGQPVIADFGTVEALAADINTVAGIAAEIEIVADADLDIATVADNIDAVTEVADWIGTGGEAGDIEVTATGSTTPRSLAARFAEEANILDHGATTAASAAANTTAIDAAIDTLKGVFVPAGSYSVNTGGLTLATAGQTIAGAPGTLGGFGGSELTTADTTGNLIAVTANSCAVRDLNLVHSGTFATNKAIYAAKATNTDDMDLLIDNVVIENFATHIEVVGRGLVMRDFTLGGGTGSEVGVLRSWPASGETGDGGTPDYQIDDGLKWRKDSAGPGYVHGLQTFWKVTGADAIYYRLSMFDIEMDIGGRIFEGAGMGLRFVNCSSYNGTNTVYYFDQATTNLSIIGGICGGVDDTTDAALAPSNVFRIISGATLSNFVIEGVSWGNTDDCIINLEESASHGRISGTFKNYGVNASGIDPAVLLASAKTYTRIDFNLTCQEGTGSDMPIYADGATLTGCTIRASYDTAKGEVIQGDFIDAGGNDIQALYGRSSQNELDNGNAQIAQRGTSFTAATTPANNDATFLLDRWRLLSDGNDIVDVSQETTTVPTGSKTGFKALVATANAKFGFLQMFESVRSREFAGIPVVASMQARKGASNATLDDVAIYVVAWSGTADAQDADPVSAWGSDGAAPTLKTNWTILGTLRAPALTNSFQLYTGRATPSSSANNIGVLIVCRNNDATVNDELFFGNVQFERGLCSTPYKPRNYADDLERCQRYFKRITSAEDNCAIATGLTASTTVGDFFIPFFNNMRGAPVNAAAVAYASMEISAGTGGTAAVTSTSIDGLTEAGVYLRATTGGGLTADRPASLRIDTSGYLELSREI